MRVNHVELHADALEVALQRLVHGLHLLGVGVRRVGIELLKHAAYGVLYELPLVNRVDIEVGYGHFGYVELAHRTVFGKVDAHLRVRR